MQEIFFEVFFCLQPSMHKKSLGNQSEASSGAVPAVCYDSGVGL